MAKTKGKKLFQLRKSLKVGHDPWSRTRLYFLYFQTCFCLSGTGFALNLTKDFVSFFRFRDEKLTRSNVRNIQDSNVNIDKVKV